MATLLSPLRRANLIGSSSTAVRCGDTTLTYAEMWDRCCRLIGALRALGLGTGDRVALITPNCHRFLELYQAVPGGGMTIVPLNWRLAPAELRYALEDSGATVLFTGIGDQGFGDVVPYVFDLDGDYEALLAAAEPVVPAEDPPEDAVAGLFYTGGTTGASKGVMLSHRNLVSNALHFGQSIPFVPDTTWLLAAPMFHAAGTVAILSTVWGGGRQVVLGVFDPAAALDLIQSEEVTATLIVPTMLAALSEEQLVRPRDVSSLRYMAHGGSPCATETVRRAHQALPGAELIHGYGATETAPLATLTGHEELLLDSPRIRSCGQPVVGVDVEVHDANGAPVPQGEVGEVAIRGPNVMLGYWNKPVETAAALVDGWYRSGDLGYQDADGYLYLVDRSKDMIVTGGENVYSTEVEEALYGHPAVLEAAVFGVPDQQWGEAVFAVVVLRSEVDADELTAHCRTTIAGYKVPKGIEFRTEPLPKSGAGKVLKRELREPYWAGRESRVAGA
jgi:long-chain acyl-CoA synthetase